MLPILFCNYFCCFYFYYSSVILYVGGGEMVKRIDNRDESGDET